MYRKLLMIFVLLLFLSCQEKGKLKIKIEKSIQVQPGIVTLFKERFDLIKGKNVGLVTNPTGVTPDLLPDADLFLQRSDQVSLKAFYAPEHGLRGDHAAGKYVSFYKDSLTGIPVYSLYGKTKKPDKKMLKGIDVLVYDIQDIGSRAYTYIYTLSYVMEAAAEEGIPILVCDRPNPLGGELVEGNVLKEKFSSFVGRYPIAYIYGMTVGELARYFNEEFGIHAKLTVIPMKGWKREMNYGATGLPWVPTSPHIPIWQSSFYCALTGVVGELSGISIGVGYTQPFKLIGAPWLNADKLADELKNVPGLKVRPAFYRPYYAQYRGKICSGVELYLSHSERLRPFSFQIRLLSWLQKNYPKRHLLDRWKLRRKLAFFDKVVGDGQIRKDLLHHISAEKIIQSWQKDLKLFRAKRKKYLIYPEEIKD